MEYFQLAAQQNYAPAPCNLGVCYIEGIGIAKDEKKAVEYYHLAAQQNYNDAQNALGRCYANGIGIPKDDKKALEYYHLAAKQYDRESLCNLASFYESRGDFLNALLWYSKCHHYHKTRDLLTRHQEYFREKYLETKDYQCRWSKDSRGLPIENFEADAIETLRKVMKEKD